MPPAGRRSPSPDESSRRDEPTAEISHPTEHVKSPNLLVKLLAKSQLIFDRMNSHRSMTPFNSSRQGESPVQISDQSDVVYPSDCTVNSPTKVNSFFPDEPTFDPANLSNLNTPFSSPQHGKQHIQKSGQSGKDNSVNFQIGDFELVVDPPPLALSDNNRPLGINSNVNTNKMPKENIGIEASNASMNKPDSSVFATVGRLGVSPSAHVSPNGPLPLNPQVTGFQMQQTTPETEAGRAGTELSSSLKFGDATVGHLGSLLSAAVSSNQSLGSNLHLKGFPTPLTTPPSDAYTAGAKSSSPTRRDEPILFAADFPPLPTLGAGKLHTTSSITSRRSSRRIPPAAARAGQRAELTRSTAVLTWSNQLTSRFQI